MRVTLIDDHELVAEAVKSVLLLDPKIEEIQTYSSSLQFFESLQKKISFPDILIIDILMPDLGGIDLLEKLKNHLSWTMTKVLILSSITDVQTIRRAIRLGVAGYLSKEASFVELTEAIHSINDGGKYVSEKLKASLATSVISEDHVILHLSPREKSVLNLICSGSTIKQVAATLCLSVHTVQGYHKSIMKKFQVNRTADLIVFAIKKGLYTIQAS